MQYSSTLLALLVLSSLWLSSAAAASSTPDAVRDIDGDELRRGQLYYAMPPDRSEGGLKLAAALNKACPLYVTKAPFYEWLGEPLAFFPENSEDDIVRVGNTLYALFAEPTQCPESTMWKLENSLVTTGGTTSSAIGPHHSRFAIEGSEWNYKFRPCPCSVGAGNPSCKMACGGYLGVVKRERVRVLGENNESPYRVGFAKVKPEVMNSIMKLRSKA